MQNFLILRKNKDGIFPERTTETAFGNIDIYKDGKDVIALPWEIVDGDKLATNYVSDGLQVFYSPVETEVPPSPAEVARKDAAVALEVEAAKEEMSDAEFLLALRNAVKTGAIHLVK